uniref:Claudin n=1 Tax=Poecilia formosa TaxID=48698 RepID=A0A096MBT6_POEFO
MASACFQIFGIFLTTIGFTGDIIICALPMWKVSAFVGNSIMTAQTFWEGLWMNCVVQSTGQIQCKFYASMLALPQELQAARALVVISIIVAFLGLLLAVTGGECTNCIEDDLAKSQIIKTFYNPDLPDAQKSELGAALFIGWGSASLMIIGGAFLCQRQQQKDGRYSVKYSAPRLAASTAAYV